MRLVSSETLELARSILERGSICDNCLGRQFAQLSTGMTNRQRGGILREELGIPETKRKCSVCSGFFQGIAEYAKEAVRLLKGLEFRSFAVGTIMSSDMIKREESLWEDVGIEHCETLKAESNRELGKLIEKQTRKRVDEKKPEVNVILNLQKDRIDLQINPLFVSGKYKKLVRGIPQTKWDKYKETVEDIIANPFMSESAGSGHAMHAAGREDIDARCLDWRPFVFEIIGPRKRNLRLREIAARINRSGKVRVKDLRFSGRKDVAETKSIQPDKTYRAIVVFENPLEKGELGVMKRIVGRIRQKTPKRVMHRRADKTRVRQVKGIRWKVISNKKLEIEIKGEAGLYIKELVTGDGGRTSPSVSELLKNPARVESLDVVKIHLKKGV